MKLEITPPKRRRGKNGLTFASFQCTKRMLELIRKEAENRGQTMSAYMRGTIKWDLEESGTTIKAEAEAEE